MTAFAASEVGNSSLNLPQRWHSVSRQLHIPVHNLSAAPLMLCVSRCLSALADLGRLELRCARERVRHADHAPWRGIQALWRQRWQHCAGSEGLVTLKARSITQGLAQEEEAVVVQHLL